MEANRRDADPLVAAVASFEAAMIRTKRGDRGRYVVAWPAEPYFVLAALPGDTPMPVATDARVWTIVAADLPGRFEVVTRLPGTRPIASA